MSATVSPGVGMSSRGRQGRTPGHIPSEAYDRPRTRPVSETQYGPVPGRSVEQRMEALEKANDHRSRRAQLKRDIKAGRVCVLDILEDPPEWAQTMKLLDLLLAVPSIGRVKALNLMRRNDVSPAKALGGLSARQRERVVAAWIWGR